MQRTQLRSSKLLYGLMEDERQRAMVFKLELISFAALQRANSPCQLFRKQDVAFFSAAWITNFLLMTKIEMDIVSFSNKFPNGVFTPRTVLGKLFLSSRFSISKYGHASVFLSMQQYMDDVAYPFMSKFRRKDAEKLVGPSELIKFKRLSGELHWLGWPVLPQALLMASFWSNSCLI